MAWPDPRLPPYGPDEPFELFPGIEVELPPIRSPPVSSSDTHPSNEEWPCDVPTSARFSAGTGMASVVDYPPNASSNGHQITPRLASELVQQFIRNAEVEPAYRPDSILTQRGPQAISGPGNPNLTLHHLGRVQNSIAGNRSGASNQNAGDSYNGNLENSTRSDNDVDHEMQDAPPQDGSRRQDWQTRDAFELEQDDEDVTMTSSMQNPTLPNSARANEADTQTTDHGANPNSDVRALGAGHELSQAEQEAMRAQRKADKKAKRKVEKKASERARKAAIDSEMIQLRVDFAKNFQGWVQTDPEQHGNGIDGLPQEDEHPITKKKPKPKPKGSRKAAQNQTMGVEQNPDELVERPKRKRKAVHFHDELETEQPPKKARKAARPSDSGVDVPGVSEKAKPTKRKSALKKTFTAANGIPDESAQPENNGQASEVSMANVAAEQEKLDKTSDGAVVVEEPIQPEKKKSSKKNTTKATPADKPHQPGKKKPQKMKPTKAVNLEEGSPEKSVQPEKKKPPKQKITAPPIPEVGAEAAPPKKKKSSKKKSTEPISSTIEDPTPPNQTLILDPPHSMLTSPPIEKVQKQTTARSNVAVVPAPTDSSKKKKKNKEMLSKNKEVHVLLEKGAGDE